MKYLYLNKYWELNKEYNLDKLLYLMIDRPDEIRYYYFSWENNKTQRHRDYDLPSDILFKTNNNKTCNLYWYKSDKLHRKKFKPAIIEDDGYKSLHI